MKGVEPISEEESKLDIRILFGAILGWLVVLALLVIAILAGIEMPIIGWPEERWEDIFLGPVWIPLVLFFAVVSLVGAVWGKNLRLVGIVGFWIMVLPCLGYVAVAIANLFGR